MKDSHLINGFDKIVAEPFFSFVITFSGHGPYTRRWGQYQNHTTEGDRRCKFEGITGEDKNSLEYYHAIAHAMETDAFIGQLMEKLEESGFIEDTVVILFSDHYAKYMSDTEYLLKIKGVSNTNLLCNTRLSYKEGYGAARNKYDHINYRYISNCSKHVWARCRSKVLHRR